MLKLNVYFAGGLFTHKELIGNKILADAVMRHDENLNIILPQDYEQTAARNTDIRNVDLMGVAMADALIVNMDGAPLDDGTVAEFMFAKDLDIPCLLFRSDFRSAGDGVEGGCDPWNLMLSGWPRCANYIIHAMECGEASLDKMLSRYDDIAAGLCRKFYEAFNQAPLLDEKEFRAALTAKQKLVGSGFDALLADEKISEICDRRKNVLAGRS